MFNRTPPTHSMLTAAFGPVPSQELVLLESLSTELRMEPGRTIMRQGSSGREVFLVVSGELRIERDGATVAMVGPGAVVGELALLRREPRNATVTTATNATVLTLSRREFATLLDRCPTLAQRVHLAAEERIEAVAA